MKIGLKYNLIFLYLLINAYLIVKFTYFPNYSCPNPTMDTDFYLLLVKLKHLKSPLINKSPYYYSPLFANYLYFLCLISDNLTFLRVFNIIMGAFIPLGFFLIGKEIFKSEILAMVLTLLSILYDGFIFYNIQISKVILGIVLIVYGLLFLLKFIANKKDKNLIISGVLFALSALIYGNIIFVLLILSFYILVKFGFKRVVILIFPLIILISLTLFRNFKACNDLVLLSAVDGIHFFIGNNYKSRGLYVKIKGIRGNAFGHYWDGKKYVEKRLKRKVKPSEASRYFKNKALIWIKNHPVSAFKLYLKKILITFNYYDFPNNIDIHYFKKNVPLFNYLTIPFWLFIVFGISGMVYLNWKDDKHVILFIFFISYMISLLSYFISDRYRMPLVIPMMIFSLIFFQNLFNINNVYKNLFAFIILVVIGYISHIDLKLPIDRVRYLTKVRMQHSKEICNIKNQIINTENLYEKKMLYKKLADYYQKIGGREWYDYYIYQINERRKIR